MRTKVSAFGVVCLLVTLAGTPLDGFAADGATATPRAFTDVVWGNNYDSSHPEI